MRLVLVLLLCASTVLAQTLTKAPALAQAPAPVAHGAGGTVLLQLDLSPDGRVVDARVEQSAGFELDALAVQTVKGLLFTPAEVDGQPALVTIQFEMVIAAEVDAGVAELPDASVPTPTVNLEGTLRVAGTREPIALADITVGAQTVSSDEAGHFALIDVPAGPCEVVVVAPGLARFEAQETITPGEKTVVTYFLAPNPTGGETVVHATRDRREVTQVKLERAELKSIAGSSGDAFKVLQSLPSVARPSLGSSALVVRGSKAWDSRVYVDEIQVPQLFHFAGLSATFNAANVERISFQPGNFGVGFGRAIGGLVLADTRAPSTTSVHGFVDASVFDVSALMEAPISKTLGFSVSAHRGLADLSLPWGLKTFAQGTVGFALAPESWDYQLRVDGGRAGRDRVFFALYGSSDRFAFLQPNYLLDLDTEGNQGSAGNAVMYHRLVAGFDRRLSEHVLFVSRNSVGFDRSEQLGGATNIFYRSTQVPIQLRERLTVEVPEWHTDFALGADVYVTPALLDAQTPPPFKPNQIPDPYVNRRLFAERSTTVHVEPGLFVEARWQPLPSLTLIGGARGDYQSAMGDAWFDPRLSVLFTPLEWLTLKAGAGIYHQPPNYRVGQLSPTFGNPDLLPEGARHVMVGAEGRVLETVSFDVQGWYKDLFAQARQVLTGGLGSDVNIPGAASRFASTGTGHAYGTDVLIRWKPSPRFFGWVAYSLSRVEREAYVGTGFTAGALDQPHNLIVVASAQLPWDVTVGARLRFASGPLVTPVTTSLYDNNGNYYYPLPGIPWSLRLPSFFQLDLRVDKRIVFHTWTLALYVDVQNATNQQNPEALFYNHNYTQHAYVYGIPVLPSVGVRGEW